MKTNGNDPINCMPSEEFSDRFNEGISLQTGLSKREYFASRAMQGILVNSHSLDIFNLKTVAGTSVEIADALIEALNKKEK